MCVHALPLESRPVVPHTHGRYNGQHSAHKRRSKNERRGARRHLTPPSSQLAMIPAPSSRLPSFRQRPTAATLDLLSKLYPRHSGASTIDSPPPPPRLRLIRAATSRWRRELRVLALPDSNDRWGAALNHHSEALAPKNSRSLTPRNSRSSRALRSLPYATCPPMFLRCSSIFSCPICNSQTCVEPLRR